MNKLLRVFFIAALVVGSPANLVFALAGTEYYVDTSAAAGGDGSSTLPWATISDAVESGQLADGDTVHIATGIYDTESFPVNLVPGVSYIGAGVSTEIQVPSSPLGSSAILHLTTQPGASNTTLSNVSLDGMAENGLSVFGSQSATTSIVVDHVTFNGIGDGNMVRVNTDNVLANLTISNCDVTDANILELSMAMGTASLSGTQVISVNDNTVNNASFDAIDIQNLRDMNCDVTISGNVGNVIGDNPIVLNLYNTPIADVTIDNNSWDLADDEVIDAVFQQYEDLNLNINNNTATNSNDDGFTISLSAYSGSSVAAVININDNTFENTDDDAIEVFNAIYNISDTISVNTTISGNSISGGADTGIRINYSLSSVGAVANIENNCNNNTMSDSEIGLLFDLAMWSNTSSINNSLKLRGNTITSNVGQGISFYITNSSSPSSSVNLGIDLGTLAEPGNNSIHSNGPNHPDFSSSSSSSSSSSLNDIGVYNSIEFADVEIPAYGNDWNSTDLAAIEDNLYHRVDDPALMLIQFDAGAPLPPGPPIAVYDTRTPADCGPLVIDVADNDLDVNGDLDLESVVITQNPAHGIVVVLGGGLVEYTADYTWVGADTFNYHISDLTGLVSNIATVQVDSPGNNELPEANYDAFSMSEADGPQTYDIAANDTVPSGRPLDLTTVDITQNPAKGTVVNNLDGTVTYTYTGDLSGALSTTDTFNYTIRDDCGVLSNVATVEVEITRVENSSDGTDNNVFKLVVAPLSVGQTAGVNFIGATANGTIKIYASRVYQLGNTIFGVSELGNPRVSLGATQANMFGSGSVSFVVPASLQGQTVWFQALDVSAESLSAATSADVN